MKWLVPILAVGVIVCLALLAWPVSPPNRPAVSWMSADEPWGEVTGKVTDATGTPVEGATVLAQDLRGFGGRAETDRNGGYRMVLMPCSRIPRWRGRSWSRASVPWGSTEIVCAAFADGFCGSTAGQVIAERGQVVVAQPIRLWRGGFVRGRTVDVDGEEVAARVRIVARRANDMPRAGTEGLPRGYPAHFVLSEVGKGFILGPVAPGEVELWASAPGVGGSSSKAIVAEGETTAVELRINLTTHISGKVVDDHGGTVASVRLFCMREADSAAPPLSPKVSPGTQQEVPKGVPSELRVEDLHPGFRPMGATRNESPVERARRRGMFATESDESGLFYFYALRRDSRYTVGILGGTQHGGAVVSEVVPSRGGVILKAPRRFDVPGFVHDFGTGRAIGGCVVQYLPSDTAQYIVRELQLGLRLRGENLHRSDSRGRFSIPAVMPGTYRVVFLAEGYEVDQRTIEIDPREGMRGSALGAKLRRAAAVKGVVRRSTGEPAPDARVEAWCVGPATPRPGTIRWIGRLAASVKANGSFVMTGLPAHEEIRLRVRDAQGRTGRQTVNLQDSEVRALTIVLQPPASLSVHISPKRGGNLAGHPIRLVGIDDPDIDLMLWSDSNGFGRVNRLPPGRYRVLAVDPLEDVTRPEVAARIQEVVIGDGLDEELEVSVPDITVVTGTVRLNEKPVSLGKVGFGPIHGTPDHFRPLMFDVKDGSFRGRVPPGTYHVHVRIPGKRFELNETVVVPNVATHVVPVELPPK